jgi:signal transduction histidine kinase
VVVNLLSNAIKYNHVGGRVCLRVSCDDSMRIEIQDTGPGMTQEQMSRLFRPFERLGAERSSVAGHGLGLLICKELVASMQGRLHVRSTVGQGTTFSVCLPAPEQAGVR